MSELDLHRGRGNAPIVVGELLAMPPHELTFAAEEAGEDERNVPALIALLGHADALVREGVVYGLSRWTSRADVVLALEALRFDPSPGVRMAASDALDP